MLGRSQTWRLGPFISTSYTTNQLGSKLPWKITQAFLSIPLFRLSVSRMQPQRPLVYSIDFAIEGRLKMKRPMFSPALPVWFVYVSCFFHRVLVHFAYNPYIVPNFSTISANFYSNLLNWPVNVAQQGSSAATSCLQRFKTLPLQVSMPKDKLWVAL